MTCRFDDPHLEVDPESVLILKHVGPEVGPGMPEWGQLSIPQKIVEEGRQGYG
jgi:dihydroxyacid dehydratase/phosphogluconate dehydratase